MKLGGLRCNAVYSDILVSNARGSAIAKIVGKNVMEFDRYDKEVLMWVYEEMIDGKKLTEIINEKHENVKYLPGTVLPNNIVSICHLK